MHMDPSFVVLNTGTCPMPIVIVKYKLYLTLTLLSVKLGTGIYIAMLGMLIPSSIHVSPRIPLVVTGTSGIYDSMKYQGRGLH